MTPHSNIGIIYIIQAEGTDRYKVGFTSRDPVKRLAELQTGSPYPLVLQHFFSGSLQDEQRLHKALTPFHVGGEWFELTVSSLLEAISYTTQCLMMKPTPSTTENDQGKAVEIGEYGPIKVVEGPHKGCEGFYSEDVEAAIHNVDEGYITFLEDSDKTENEQYITASVYLEGIGPKILPHSTLIPE